MRPRRYSTLTDFWQCPRRYAWSAQGYQAIETPDAMLRGSMAHAGIAAHLGGEKPAAGVARVALAEVQRVRDLKDPEAEKRLEKLAEGV